MLDTHILVHWLHTPKKLTREQERVLREAVRHNEPVAISAMTLMEVAVVFGEGTDRRGLKASDILAHLEREPAIEVLPATIEIAHEMAALGRYLRDPGDRAIVATARVHRLRLLTSDQRIIESAVVPVVV